jgi:chromosome partitioning protein
MSILVVAATKGGTGKSTLATNITVARAIAGRSVLLIDGDEQRTALDFTELRSEVFENVGYTAVGLQDRLIKAQAVAMASKYDDTIIDVGGRANLSLGAAMVVAHTILIPVQPRSFDILAIGQMLTMVEKARDGNPNDLRVLAILNAADPGGKDNEATLEFLKSKEGLEVLDITIGRRKVFSSAAATGRSVLEYVPKDQKAIDEINALVEILYSKKEDK